MSRPQRNYRGKAMRMIDPEVFRPANMAAELKRLEMVPARKEQTWCSKCGEQKPVLDVFSPGMLGLTMFIKEGENWCAECARFELDNRLAEPPPDNLKGGLD